MTSTAAKRSATKKVPVSVAMVNISASVPKALIDDVRKSLGNRRGLSQFITKSLQRELARENQIKFANEIVAVTGPLDKKRLARMKQLLND